MKPIDATYLARALAILGCLFLLPSCTLVNSLVKLPGNIVKTAARTVGISNLTDQSAQPIYLEARSEARGEQEEKTIESAAAQRKLDAAERVSE